jgi:MFS family permease
LIHLSPKQKVILVVTVASLGYFVDAYDLILFVVVRKASLLALGVSTENLTSTGLNLFNFQMAGTFLGGIFFGIMGDKRGRLSVLFGSILVYSIANLLNAGVWQLWQYFVLRFIAGFGLAGELGAGITLVSEIMPKEKRGYGTAIVAASGAFGAFFAGVTGDLTHWRISYAIGGTMGLLLLLLRMGTFESKLFQKNKTSEFKKGDFLGIFMEKGKAKKYLATMFISLPVFFTITILMQLAPEVAYSLGLKDQVSAGKAVTFVYLGLTIGDLSSGLLSQFLKNRLIAIRIFLFLSILMTLIHLNAKNISLEVLYLEYVLLGWSAGFWVSLITLAAEQFGTNIRATVATTIPNFARGAAIPISLFYQFLLGINNNQILASAQITGVICFILAILSSFLIKDTFKKNLDFQE